MYSNLTGSLSYTTYCHGNQYGIRKSGSSRVPGALGFGSPPDVARWHRYNSSAVLLNGYAASVYSSSECVRWEDCARIIVKISPHELATSGNTEKHVQGSSSDHHV